MKSFRRRELRRAAGPTVATAHTIELDELRSIPREVRDELGQPSDRFCVAMIDGRAGRYTLILDLDWMLLACDADQRQHELVAGIELPRGAVRAVINGWQPEHRDLGADVTRAADGIPHIGFTIVDTATLD